MLFNSFTFVIFFTLVCIAMAATNLPAFQAMPQEKRLRVRHIILLFASYVFYGWWTWRCCFLMLGLTVVAHLCALQSSIPSAPSSASQERARCGSSCPWASASTPSSL